MKRILTQLIITTFLFCCCFIANADSSTDSSKKPPLSSEQWRFSITPYGWLIGMSGDLTTKGNTTHVSSKPVDVFDYIDDLDFFGELHAEVSKGNWAFIINPTYLKLTTEATVGPINATISPRIGLLDFGVFYSVNQFLWNSTDANTNTPTIQAFVGGRYVSLENILTLDAGGSFKGEQDWVVPIIGGRIYGSMSPSWRYSLRGDIGGFGIDNNNFTWSAVALAHYAIQRHVMFSLGYRVLDEDYSVGTGANKFAFDVIMHGPLVGLTITW